MAIRRSKEKSLQFNGELEEAKSKCLDALKSGGFKKIEENESLNNITAKFYFLCPTIFIFLGKNWWRQIKFNFLIY